MAKPLTYHQAAKKQNEKIEELKKEHPELLERGKEPLEKEMLQNIGIDALPENRGKGYLRLFLQDFIVEEVLPSKEVVEIEPSSKEVEILDEEGQTIYCDMVKAGVAHNEAIKIIANGLGIEETKVSYAGIKDAAAVTAQRITLRGVDLETVQNTKFEGLFLKNLKVGKGVIAPGELKGNRFTIFVRTEKKAKKNEILKALSNIQENGYLNYYHTQRFGGFRQMSHRLGAYILRGDFEKTVIEALFYTSPYDIKIVRDKRAQAREAYPDVDKIIEIYNELPKSFIVELRILDYLKENPEDYLGALKAIQDQTKLWGMAYSSYLFNSYLTAKAKKGEKIPREIPLLFSQNRADREIYLPWLKEHKTEDFVLNVRPISYLFNLKRRKQETKIFPEIISAGIVPEGVIISFVLPKGSYATTFLNNLFELYVGEPRPDWVKLDEYDVKATLGMGSVGEVKEVLGEYMVKEF